MSPPSPWAIITRAASRETRNEPLAITSCCRSQSATVVSSSGLDSDSPALLTTRSTPPKASTAAASAAAHGVLVGDVGGDADRHVRRRPSSAAAACALARSRSATTTQAPSAAIRAAMALPMPDAAPVTSAIRVASGLGLGIRGELGLLERPVLDAELLRLADRRVGRHRLGAAHHVDRVDVELAGHPRGLLVLAEGEHARRRAPARSPGRRRASRGESGVALRS